MVNLLSHISDSHLRHGILPSVDDWAGNKSVGLLIQGLMLNTHSLSSPPHLQLSMVLPWGTVLRRGWGVRSARFFAVITTRWLHFWFPVSWQLGCALVIWNVRIVEESLGILHVLQSFIQIHSSLTISGPSKCLSCGILPLCLHPHVPSAEQEEATDQELLR